ncbi:ion transporter [Rufibacter quisquiliarum]|uniref:Voltage-gated potassium channel n=1 Tax=Rufibacter quisquiliarum TaxID=1549639 RepID=A0A839GVD1_9BACT|nr:ion transporter [Rufibacter quisquiliarum]MBA9078388.1 voltage-gated potassium channel [Rufibacter quisquiliarum]
MPEKETPPPVESALNRERRQLLRRIQHAMEGPMIVLGFVWLVLLVVEFIRGLGPVLELVNYCIWGVFILDFLLRFVLAPEKLPFLKTNWLTLISLAVPALRVFRLARFVRVFRTVRAVRGIRLVRVLSSLNRGMKSLRATMGRRGFGYMLALTLAVLLAGAAGMYVFEREAENGLNAFGEALWWTAMILISLGSEYWPQTPEGRALCFLLALYGFAVFGYFTALLASFFLDRDAANQDTEIAGAAQINQLHQEVRALRAELQAVLAQQQQKGTAVPGNRDAAGEKDGRER